ncbi:MAG: 1,4-dihydroxy-2-naphthoate octaprenyltransferase [Salinivirgaceae bacterium]|jgi:1,4-dihydroxy-2-naphthoate octaprenyltransferase
MNITKLKAWIHAARLRTLPLSVAGIILGSLIAYSEGKFHIDVFVLALVTTLLLQILSNLANDYGDFTHGTDNENRVGPERAVQSGIISAKEMKRAIYIVGLLAFHAGMFLITVALNEIFNYLYIFFMITGLVAIGAAIKYTVGKTPFGYKGFGDVMVFLFFGLAAVVGTYFLHTLTFQLWILLPAVTIGLLSVGVLNINNMRDVENDRTFGKMTIPVRFGKSFSKIYHALLLAFSMISLEVFILNTGNLKLALSMGFPFLLLVVHAFKVIINKEPRLLDRELKRLALTTLLIALWCGIGLSL